MNLLWRAFLSVGGGSVIGGSGPAWAGACASSSFFFVGSRMSSCSVGSWEFLVVPSYASKVSKGI